MLFRSAWAAQHLGEAAYEGRRAAVRAGNARGAGRHAGVRRETLQIVSPADGSTYLIDPTLRREFQTLSLRAVAMQRGPIEWAVNGQQIGAADADAKVDWPLAPGKHRITARDAEGRMAEAHVVVR